MLGSRKSRPDPTELRLEAFGVRLAVTCETEWMLEDVRKILPPGWREADDRHVQATLTLADAGNLRCDVLVGEHRVARDVEPKVAIGILDARLRAEVSSRAVDWTFIHAGVVALDDRALVIPGRSFSGKTTLVGELIRAGAAYFSDEYAVLDGDGRVHPYPKPLSVRIDGSRQHTNEVSASDFGAEIAERSAQIAAVVQTSYDPEATWEPTTGTVAEAALALLSHAVPAREDPQRVMSVVSRAAATARLLDGHRGEAAQAAPRMLELLADPVPANLG